MNPTLTAGGWFIMITSVSFVTVLMVWCIYKVLTTPESTKHLHSQADIDTKDKDD